ncbi:VENN motif pre-toxin domain-containing protein, partial [Bartonella sp. AU18XJBT]|uniref:VENN motif pre-toxin domain-containing protein n=1 Tax=Bartonella sp. AU18XJBT TaxID=3019089 RepID=UPI002362773E
TLTQIVAHAGLGCLKGAVASGACSAGAIGGAVGEATAMLQFKLWSKNFIQKEIAALNGRPLTVEDQARIGQKIKEQFSDFKDHAIDIARAAGGVAAALAGGDVNAGADAAGNAAENNSLALAAPLVLEAGAVVSSITPLGWAILLVGGVVVVVSYLNKDIVATTDPLGNLAVVSKSAEGDSEKTDKSTKEEKNKASQASAKDPQNNNDDDNDGKGKKLNKAREHHDKKRDEKKQKLEEEGFSPSEKELTIEIELKTDKGTIKVRTRPDNTFIKDGKPAFDETKTGKAKLSKWQKGLREICKTTGSIKFCGPEAEKYLEQNKEKFNEYQKDLKNTIDKFKGSVKELEEKLDKFNKNWAKDQLDKKWNEGILHYGVDRHPSYLKGK